MISSFLSIFFCTLFQDCLVKQGMYTQYAEVALKNVSDFVNSPNYDINLVRNTITALMPRVDSKGFLQQNPKEKKGMYWLFIDDFFLLFLFLVLFFSFFLLHLFIYF